MEIPGKRREKKNHARLSEILYKAARHSKLFNTMWILYLSLFLFPQKILPHSNKIARPYAKVCLCCFDLKK